jgi:hypothetical protein
LDLGPPMREPSEAALFVAAAKSLQARAAYITKESVLREPRCSNSRLVWAERYRHVPVGVRGRILEQLHTHGSSTIERIGPDLKNAILPTLPRCWREIAGHGIRTTFQAHPEQRLRKSRSSNDKAIGACGRI